MENKGWLKVVIISLSIIISGFLIGEMRWTSQKNNRRVEVKGVSQREVKANLAIWPMQITVTSNNLNQLNKDIENQKLIVYKFFKSQGFTDTEIILGITNIDDAKANLYDGSNKRTSRYLANSDITLRTIDIQKIKKAQIKSINLASQGILINSKNNWRPVEFLFTSLNSIKPEMVEEATKKAKEIAEKFAEDSSSKVGKIKYASQGLFTISNRDESTPDIKLVRVVTTINYFLED